MSEVKLYQGDCLEILPTLEAGSVDAVITDPPYGVNYSSGWESSWEGEVIHGDMNTVERDYIVDVCSGLPMAIFGNWKVDPPKGTRAKLIWDKGPASGMGDLSFPWKCSWEEIYIIGNGWKGFRDEGVIKNHNIVTWQSLGRSHPNEKPVSLLKHIIRKLPEGCTILDPFMGSGTTGVACVQTGRNFIGIEIDPTYYAIAEKRIAQAQLQIRMEI